MGKNISKNVSSKYSQKLIDHGKKYTSYALKTGSKRGIQNTTEATGDLIGNKISDKIIRVSKTSPNEEEILKKRFIPLELKQKIIDDFRLKEENY